MAWYRQFPPWREPQNNRNAEGVGQTAESNPRDESRLLGCILTLFVPPPSRCCRQEATEALHKIHKPAAVNSLLISTKRRLWVFFSFSPAHAWRQKCAGQSEMKGSNGEEA